MRNSTVIMEVNKREGVAVTLHMLNDSGKNNVTFNCRESSAVVTKQKKDLVFYFPFSPLVCCFNLRLIS